MARIIARKTMGCLAALAAAGCMVVAGPGPAAAAGMVVKQTKIDLFQGPGTGYSIVATAGRGETLAVLGQKGAWAKVRLPGGTSGWIPAALVGLDQGTQGTAAGASSSSPPAALPPAVTPTVPLLNVRSGPGLGHPVITSTRRGDHLVVKSESGQWYQVRTPDGIVGWVAGWYTQPVSGRADPSATDSPSSSSSSSSSSTTAALTASSSLTLFNGPGSGTGIAGQVPKGTSLTVLQTVGAWAQVHCPGGASGWIPAALVPQDGSSGGTASPKSGSDAIIVSQPHITLFGGPSTGSATAGQIPKGTALTVLQTRGAWAQVQLPGGASGWIPAALVSTNVVSVPEPSRGEAPSVLTGAPYDGKGTWCDIYGRLPQAADLQQFAAAGITHIYVEVATTQSGFPAKWQDWLNTLLPAAHRVGIKVIPWIYVELHNPVDDAKLTSQVANYVTPLGDRPDGVAADIETLPTKNPVAASQLLVAYAVLTRPKLPAKMPFIVITFPPQYRPNYPYAAMGDEFNAIALMDYWHITAGNYNYDDAKAFVASSLSMTRSQAGAKIPIEVILQGYNAGKGMPSAQEIQGALAGAKGAAGYSIYTWNSALGTPAGTVFDKYRPGTETPSEAGNDKK